MSLSQNGRVQESHRPPGFVTSTEQGARYSIAIIRNKMKDLLPWPLTLQSKDVCKVNVYEFSNIQNFVKIPPWSHNELFVSEMRDKMGVTDFVSKIKRGEETFRNLVQETVRTSPNILNCISAIACNSPCDALKSLYVSSLVWIPTK